MVLRAISVLGLGVLALVGCRENDLPFEITAQDEGKTLVAVGVIDDTTPFIVEQALFTYPQAETLILQFVPGSMNEEQNKVASRMIRDHGLKTIVPADGLVASGGTAMFVAGKERVLEKGACVGVHTWWVNGFGPSGDQLAPDDEEHDEYLDYYRDMGITPEFYWFGIRAAGSEDFHWMDRKEIETFGLETNAKPYKASLKNQPIFCDSRHDAGYDLRIEARREEQSETREAALERLAKVKERRAAREAAEAAAENEASPAP
ncbi:MAG: hypothetical protein AAFR74_07280 [Pseudomonadota bacterium]